MGIENSGLPASQGKGWSDTLWKTYKHPDKNSKLNVSIEEAYIVKKQLSLNLQFISCSKI
jgi:hypothetical protein